MCLSCCDRCLGMTTRGWTVGWKNVLHDGITLRKQVIMIEREGVRTREDQDSEARLTIAVFT